MNKNRVGKKEYILTKSGLKKLQTELERRKTKDRKKIVDSIETMREAGDLSENDGYTMAIEQQHANEDRIDQLKDLIENAIIKKQSSNNETIDVGSVVTIVCKNKKKRILTIVGAEEGNPLKKKISYLSPIGKVLMGKQEGDTITITTPKGESECTIEKIR